MKTKPKHIIVADDHPLLLEGIISVISKDFPDFKISSANNGAEVLDLIHKEQPDIAILDIEMPLLNGIEVVKKLKEENISTKIIILTLHKERSLFNEIKNLGVKGYVLKEFSIDQITNCIKKVIAGDTYFSSPLEDVLQESLLELSMLTKSELHIIQLIAEGKTSNEIAEMLFLSVKTIESHRSNICKKLNLKPIKNSLLKWVYKNIESIRVNP